MRRLLLLLVVSLLGCEELEPIRRHPPYDPPPPSCRCEGQCLNELCMNNRRVLVQLATADAGYPAGIAVNASEVFWLINGPRQMGDGLIMRAPISGGAAVVLAANQALPWHLVTTPDGLWWANQGPGSAVMHDPLDGGGPRFIASTSDGVWAVTVTDEEVFFTSGSGLWRLPKELTTVPQRVGDRSFPWQLASDATHVYWWGADFMLSRMLLDGGAAQTLTRGRETARSIAVRDGTVYWSEVSSVRGDDGTVNALPLDGGLPRALASSLPTSLGLQVDATHVYWASGGTAAGYQNDGIIARCPLEGCGECLENREVIMCGQARAFDLALDATRVYWTSEYGIWAIDK